MPLELLYALVGMLLVVGLYFWFVRKPDQTKQPDQP